MTSLDSRRVRPVRAVAVAVVGGAVLLTGCGTKSGSRSVADSASAPGVPFDAATSIAAPGNADVAKAVQALAAAELELSQDMAPLQGTPLDSYLQGLAGASESTRRSVERIAASGGSCGVVSRAITAASAGVTSDLDAALSRFNGQVSTLKASMAKVAADRAAVAQAAAALKAALASNPGAWQVPGVDTSGSTLESIAKWQISVADAITAAQGKASSYASVRHEVFTSAAGVRRSCTSAATRERSRATTRQAAATSSSPAARYVPPTPPTRTAATPARTSSTPPTAPTTPSTTPTSSTPTPSTTTPTPTTPTPTTPTPTETTPTPVDTTPTPVETTPSPVETAPTTSAPTTTAPATTASSSAPDTAPPSGF